MNPKAFRMLLGALGVCIVSVLGITIGVMSYAKHVDASQVSMLTRYFDEWHQRIYGQPPWEEAVKTTSDRALKSFQHDLKDPTRVDITLYKKPIHVTEGPDSAAQLVDQIKDVVNEYLASVQSTEPADSEVQQLAAADLDLRLLKFLVQQHESTGRKRLFVAFDDKFKEHIFERAPLMTTRRRLLITTYVCFAVGVTMCFLFGALKVVNSRPRTRPERDFLRRSGVSML